MLCYVMCEKKKKKKKVDNKKKNLETCVDPRQMVYG